jgi:hypothetical protein
MRIESSEASSLFAELANKRISTGARFFRTISDECCIEINFQQKEINLDADAHRKYSIFFSSFQDNLWCPVSSPKTFENNCARSFSGSTKIIYKTVSKDGKEREVLEVWKADIFYFSVELEKIATKPHFESGKCFLKSASFLYSFVSTLWRI